MLISVTQLCTVHVDLRKVRQGRFKCRKGKMGSTIKECISSDLCLGRSLYLSSEMLKECMAGDLYSAGLIFVILSPSVLTTFGLSERSYGLNQLRYDLRKLKGHGLLERDGSRYAYRLTSKGIQVALLFLFFHKRLCGPLANSRFHHRPDPSTSPKQPTCRQARQHRRQGRALRRRQPQADHRMHRGRSAGAQLQTLLADLATYCRIQATTALNEKYLFTLHTRPTPIQQRAFELLGIKPDRTQ